MVRVLVCGGRQFEDRDTLNAALDKLHLARGFTLLIAGGARGADSLAEAWAKAAGVPRQDPHAVLGIPWEAQSADA